MKLSIVIPCYNERETIAGVISAVRSAPVNDTEIIVVDDCSTGGTTELLRDELASSVDRVICHEKNLGKGAALRSGFVAATGDIILIQAVFEYCPGA